MEGWLNILSGLEGVDAILINIQDALEDNSISPALARQYLDKLIGAAQSLDLNDPGQTARLQSRSRTIVFDELDTFQRAAILKNCEVASLVTFRTLSGIEALLEGHSGLKEEIIRAGGPEQCFHSSNASGNATAEDCRILASHINDVGERWEHFFLALDTQDHSRKRLVFFTFRRNLEDRLASDRQLGETMYARRIRNWLGLGHMHVNEHLFAMESIIDPDQMGLDKFARPTVFDGIDNSWFKHKRENGYGDDWGRTLDLETLGLAEIGKDGGCEAVVPGPRFSRQFRCRYVGRIGAAMTDSRNQSPGLVTTALLRERSFGDLRHELARRLDTVSQ